MRHLFPAAMLAIAVASPALADGMCNVLMSQEGVYWDNQAKAQSLGMNVTLDSITNFQGYNLGQFDMIWINPGDPDYGSLQGLVGGGGALEQYAANGGSLVINVAGNSGSHKNIAPGGVDYFNYADYNSFQCNDARIANAGHPYITGAGYGGTQLFDSDFDNPNGWGCTHHGHLTDLPGNAVTVVENYQGDPTGATFVEYKYGAGRVIVTSMTYGWGGNGGQANPQTNLLLYGCTQVPAPASASLLGLAGLAASRRRR